MSLYDAIVELLIEQGAWPETARELASYVVAKWSKRVKRDASDKQCADMFGNREFNQHSIAEALGCCAKTTYNKLHRYRAAMLCKKDDTVAQEINNLHA